MPPRHPLYLQTVEGETGYVPASHASSHEDGGSDALALGDIAGTLDDAQVVESNVTNHQAALAIATTQLTGDMPDARIVVGNVTQHQAALSIAETQIPDGSIFARVAAAETIAGLWNFTESLKNAARRISNTTRYTTTQTIPVTDHIVFCNTDGGDWTATLPAGAEGQTFKIINSGSSGNDLTVATNGTEHIFGADQDFILLDGESLELTYNATDGWY